MRPPKYRQKLSPDGKQIIHEWYDDYKGTQLLFTQTDIKDETGKFVPGQKVALQAV